MSEPAEEPREQPDEPEAEPPARRPASKRRAPPPTRPPFLEAFPAHPALDALVRAFEDGNYGKVRREAPDLARAEDIPEEVRAAATELRRRVGTDPIAVWLLGLTLVLLAVVSAWWAVRGKAPQGGFGPNAPATTIERVRP